MITRKVQYRNDCFLTVIPKTLAAILGLKPGDKVSFQIEDRKIVIAPVQPLKAETGAAQHPGVSKGDGNE
jgi:AbrB family looped-hinge helix DNA binding protein